MLQISVYTTILGNKCTRFKAFHLFLKNVHLYLMMVVWAETCSIPEHC